MPQPEDTGARSQSAKDVALLLLALGVMAGAMATYWLYPYPSGNRPDIWGFIAFFLREALLLVFLAAIGLFLLAVTVLRAAARLAARVRSHFNVGG